VVVRADWDKSKVALVSGGGSGHEPAHAGFIGKGMLTAAVCGDVFASPSVDAVLAGILAVTGPAGCLLIVKNYTGDRLNFGLAAERARAFGHKVSIVIVDDDVALPELPQARGLAGTLFVHKIAGAMAENGATLDTCTQAAERVIKNCRSIGMSLDTCTVPGSQKEDRIPEGMAELGLGIHGEAGVEQIAADGAKYSVDKVAEKLLATMPKTPHAVLVNNLGGATELEMAILTKELMESGLSERTNLLVGPSSMMTALDMHGFSISALELTEDDAAMLAQPVECGGWPGCIKIKSNKVLPLPDGLSPIRAPASEHAKTKDFLLACCEVLIASELEAIFFAAAGDASSAGQTMTNALKSGLARLCQIGGAKPGDRTMVDALAPALDALDEGLESAAIAARKGADYTATLTRAKAGRATYINAQQLSGHVDPGAEAVARLFEHLSK